MTKKKAAVSVKSAVKPAPDRQQKKKGVGVVSMPAPKEAPPEPKTEEPPTATPVESAEILPDLPKMSTLSATGPSAKFPYGIRIKSGGKTAYERFKTAEARDLRLGALGKREEVAAVDHSAAQAEPEAPVKGPVAVPSPKSRKTDPGANKRITPGAKISEWRPVKSLRKAEPGFFAQGGHYVQDGGLKRFIVGDEKLFSTMAAAAEFCKKQKGA